MKGILILGGTGYTGKLIVRYLADHRDRKHFSLGLAARSKEGLEHILTELSLKDVKTHAINVNDQDALAKIMPSYTVVINAIGSYYECGTTIVLTCLTAGIDYLDLSGETPWVMEMIQRYDLLDVGQNSAKIIPSCGFQCVPSDLSAYESVKKLREEFGDEIDVGLSQTAHYLKAFVSRGTLSSAYTLVERIPRDLLWTSLEPFSLSPVKGNHILPTKITYSVTEEQINGSYFLLGYTNRAFVNRSWGLRQLKESGKNIISEPNFRYEEFLVSPSRMLAVVLGIVSMCVGILFVYAPPFRWILRRIFASVVANPEYSTLKSGKYVATNVTRVSGKNSVYARTIFKTRGCDIGYIGSSVIISECALLLVLSRSELPLNTFRSNIITPSVAFGSKLTDRLRETEYFHIRTDVMTSSG